MLNVHRVLLYTGIDLADIMQILTVWLISILFSIDYHWLVTTLGTV